MIDFVKIEINEPGLHERLLQDEALTFHRGRDNRHTSKKCRDLVFILHDSGRVEIRVSLHKYWNQGVHNWNDFTRVDLWDTIHELCQWLQIAPAGAVLHNIEFGVNLQVPFSPPDLIRDLIAYKSYPFGQVSVPNGGTYYQSRTTDYYVKCYDKGTQYGRPENLLRFEIKVKSMRYLHRAGVRTLEDLMRAEKLTTLGGMLSEAWEAVLTREVLPAAELTTKEREVVETVRVTDLKELDRRRRSELIKRYRSVIERTLHQGGRKNIVAALIGETWKRLTNPDVCNDLQHLAKTTETGRLQRLSIDCKRPGNVQLELFTSTTSTPPPATAILTSTTASDGYKIKKRKRDYHPAQYYIDHNRRNEKSNGPNNLYRQIVRPFKHPQCFDLSETLKLSPDQKALLHRIDATRLQRAGLS